MEWNKAIREGRYGFDSELDIYAFDEAKLRKQGLLIDDFDILIGAASVANNIIMVTNNVSHLGRLTNIVIEDWTRLATQ